jgi:hypothetical protein
MPNQNGEVKFCDECGQQLPPWEDVTKKHLEWWQAINREREKYPGKTLSREDLDRLADEVGFTATHRFVMGTFYLENQKRSRGLDVSPPKRKK